MSNPNETAWPVAIALWFLATLQQLHPAAAAGAAFGCFFMLFYPDPDRASWWELFLRKVGLLVFSWGMGYFLGSGHAAEGGHYAGAIACATSALAAVVFGAVNLMVRNDSEPPKWLAWIADRIPVLRRREDG